VVLAGRGVVLSGAAEELIDFCERHSLPILTSIGGIDLIGDDHPLFFGRPNYWGQREANFIIQNADLILSIGAGLHFETTGFQSELFARHATIISVDIDLNELNKPSPRIDEKILCDAGFFLRSAVGLEVIKPKEAWLRYCAQVRERFKFDQFPDPEKSTRVPLYEAIELISNTLDSDTTIVYGNAGSHFTTSVQCFRVKFGQTLISCVGIGAMGASIPIAIGSAFASPKRRVVVFTGDGGFQFNMQELANIVGYGLPIHLFVFENGGYASLRGTQKRYFNGRLICSSPESNLFLPNIAEVASAFGIKVNEINERHELNEGIRWNLAQPMALTVLHIDLETPIQPKLGSSLKNDGDMISDPLEDLSPHLSNDEFHRWMLIPSLRTGQKLSES
jgi:acetolactate synthase-1/2/3 large subunit